MRACSVLAVAALCASIFAASPSAQSEKPDRRSCAQATRPVAQALAERAAQHLAKAGPKQAFADFQHPAGGFLDGDLYVFVFDAEGVLVSSGGFPQHVGRNLLQHGGSAANVGAMFKVAKELGKGWTEYQWVNPCSSRRETKISYVVRVGEYIVGVGAYLREGV
jgi:cytochrome c